LSRIREKGLARAKRSKSELLAYLEAHIEQGPVLEHDDVPVGVVSAIAGQTRIRAAFTGRAGHAGTTPMNLRQDALGGAAEVVLAAEKVGVLATVGQCDIENSAGNVIPGRVAFTLDVRDVKDAKRRAACAKLRKLAGVVAKRRGLKLSWGIVQETPTAAMDAKLTAVLRKAAGRAPLLPSGAGHDAAVMSKVCPAAMLFVRCKGGISHHPEESVRERDVAVALDVLTRAVLDLCKHHG
jgi:allantoate deiminase